MARSIDRDPERRGEILSMPGGTRAETETPRGDQLSDHVAKPVAAARHGDADGGGADVGPNARACCGVSRSSRPLADVRDTGHVGRNDSLATIRAIGYRRISTVEQAGSGLGLDAQQTAIAAAAARLELPLADTFTDAGISGGLPLEQRPALLAALDAIRRGDVLIVAKRDRLGRDVLNVAMFERLAERKGARIVSAAGEGTDTNDPTSRLMRQIVDCFAEYERAIIRARTCAALQVKKARGERVGGIPFGYSVSGPDLVINCCECGPRIESPPRRSPS
jgi:DNA invertase Pin-like site-specific DNA recombinase